ncbi:MAG TPA: tetratricopeptide repeat protein, partial [Polyangiaceae bacterium]|nr:tetratricopeptide repeat protein [Polyangiaceae bacterium]
AARRSFEVALEIHEPNPHAHAELARERMRAGDGAAAVQHAARAVALRRQRARYHVLLGDARRVAGEQNAARRAYEQALRLDPDNAAASRALGR